MITAKLIPAGLKKLGATWDPIAWEASRDEVIKRYLQQRYTMDPVYRTMIQKIKEQNGTILLVRGVIANYLSVGRKADGTIVRAPDGDDNAIGRWMMELA